MRTFKRIANTLHMPVVDAAKDLKLRVTNKDTKESDNYRGNAQMCPLARSAKRKRGVKAAQFLRTTAMILTDAGKFVRYMLSRQASVELMAWDKKGIFDPGVYLLKAPRTSEKVVTKRKYNARYYQKLKDHKPIKKVRGYRRTKHVREAFEQ